MGVFTVTVHKLMFIMIIVVCMVSQSISIAKWPPSPGYFPSKKFKSMSFYQGFRNLWGPQHQRMDQNALTIWLDQNSGSFLFHTTVFPFFDYDLIWMQNISFS